MFDLGNAPMIAVIVVASYFPIVVNVIQGMETIKQSHIRALIFTRNHACCIQWSCCRIWNRLALTRCCRNDWRQCGDWLADFFKRTNRKLVLGDGRHYHDRGTGHSF